MGYVLSGPTSPLAFSESVLCIINKNAKLVENKEHLWRMWSIVVNPLTEWINRVWLLWFSLPENTRSVLIFYRNIFLEIACLDGKII